MNSLKLIARRFRRFRAMFDKSAWLLIAPALAIIFFLDPALGRTLLTWSAFGVAIAGVSVIISRIIFPQIDLSAMVRSVSDQRNTGAAIVVASVILFVALVMIALVMWAKA